MENTRSQPSPRDPTEDAGDSRTRGGAGHLLSFPAPPPAPAGAADRGLSEGWLLHKLRHVLGQVPLRCVLWNGREATLSDTPPVAVMRIKDRRALWGLLWDPELRFGEAYRKGRVEVEGDLPALLAAVYRVKAERERTGGPRRWFTLGGNGLRASRHNVHHHYDLGNDFYRLWLDREMLYTCAYFPEPGASLEEAQVAKMDHVCRKLRLQPGEHVVEAGCGWGTFALHMARRYGVRVKAYNVSREQIRYARERARREGLTDRVEFVEEDYRKITGRFDVFVSVGMLEHVGLGSYPSLARVIDRCLSGGEGRGLLHFIGRDRPQPLNRWIRRRIFPGAYPPTLGQVFERVLQPAGLSVLDVENLRRHYALTLEHWLARFEQRWDAVVERYGEAFARTWRLYLAGSMAAFTSGSLQLFQVSFSRGGSDAIAWTRAELYGG